MKKLQCRQARAVGLAYVILTPDRLRIDERENVKPIYVSAFTLAKKKKKSGSTLGPERWIVRLHLAVPGPKRATLVSAPE